MQDNIILYESDVAVLRAVLDEGMKDSHLSSQREQMECLFRLFGNKRAIISDDDRVLLLTLLKQKSGRLLTQMICCPSGAHRAAIRSEISRLNNLVTYMRDQNIRKYGEQEHNAA